MVLQDRYLLDDSMLTGHELITLDKIGVDVKGLGVSLDESEMCTESVNKARGSDCLRVLRGTGEGCMTFDDLLFTENNKWNLN